MDMERSWPPPRTILSLSKRSAGEKRGRVVVSPSSPWKNSREPRASGLRTRSRREERFDAVASGATSNAEIVRNALGAQRVRAAPGRLLRCRSSTMLRHRLRRGRLAYGPAALRTRPVRFFSSLLMRFFVRGTPTSPERRGGLDRARHGGRRCAPGASPAGTARRCADPSGGGRVFRPPLLARDPRRGFRARGRGGRFRGLRSGPPRPRRERTSATGGEVELPRLDRQRRPGGARTRGPERAGGRRRPLGGRRGRAVGARRATGALLPRRGRDRGGHAGAHPLRLSAVGRVDGRAPVAVVRSLSGQGAGPG